MLTPTPRKPVNIIYGADDRPPLSVTVLSGLQQVGLMAASLLFPLVLIREAGLSSEQALDVLSLSMLAIGIGAVLPAMTRGPTGAGYFGPQTFSAIYITPSLLAVKVGGLPLLFGMTVLAGLIEALLARMQRYMRPFFPPEIAGLIVVMVAFAFGAVGVKNLLGIGTPEQAHGRDWLVAAASLGTMVALNVWSRGLLRVLCALIGMAAGYLVAALLGYFSHADLERVMNSSLMALPSLGHIGWSFDSTLVIPFAVAAFAACIKAVGVFTTCQKINDADWKRPDLERVGKGVLADATGTVTAGLLGTMGLNASPSSVGLSAATGVTSRSVAWVVGCTFALLAFFPQLAAVLALTPRPVLAATLIFASCFILVNGLEMITSRLLDARRTFVLGLSVTAGLSVDFFPAYYSGLAPGLQPFVGSSFVLGVITATLLNLLFRLGVRKTQRLVVRPDEMGGRRIEEFLETQGAIWGARRDVIDRATFNLAQSVEVIVDSCEPQGDLHIEVTFDEYNLDARVMYAGAPLEFPERRPSNEEIMESDEGQRRLAGFMLRRHADRVAATHKAGRTTILFHFDH